MAELKLGTQGMTDEDRQYTGSRFSEVVAALFANPYQRVWGAPGEPAFPVHEVTFEAVTQGILPGGPPHAFDEASARAIDSGADLRWGVNRQGFRRLVHPNGLCLIGTWQITAETPYSGYFATGSRGLAVARYSTCCTETRRGQTRSLSLVGKIYPTTDPNHPAPLRTANFMTQQDIGGEDTEFINDAVLRNAPDTTAVRRGTGLPALLVTGSSSTTWTSTRPSASSTRSPSLARARAAGENARVHAVARGAPATADCRERPRFSRRDDGAHLRQRRSNAAAYADVHYRGHRRGRDDRPRVQGAALVQELAHHRRMTFDNAAVSYNGDCVIHFRHPTWREDRNDPATATRVDGHKVRRA